MLADEGLHSAGPVLLEPCIAEPAGGACHGPRHRAPVRPRPGPVCIVSKLVPSVSKSPDAVLIIVLRCLTQQRCRLGVLRLRVCCHSLGGSGGPRQPPPLGVRASQYDLGRDDGAKLDTSPPVATVNHTLGFVLLAVSEGGRERPICRGER